MISEVFIRRPRLAFVISIVITIAGLIAMRVIPVSQYPEIAPPTVQVLASYSGASTDSVEEAVALPIESQVNGVAGMRYMRSNSNNSGQYALQVMFELGEDPDIATVNVQNRVKLAEPKLPQSVRDQGLSIFKASTDILQVFTFHSDNKDHDQLFLANFVAINIVDELKRIDGVGDVYNFGLRDYAMRVWIDPQKLADLDIAHEDVVSAIRSQHLQAAAGRVGAAPLVKGSDTQLQMTITTKGKLTDVGEFEDIIVRAMPDGSYIRIKDIAEVELGGQFYDVETRFQGEANAPVAIYLSPGANAVSVAEAVREKLHDLEERFPDGVKYTYIYDTAEFVEAMIKKVEHTLIEAFILVGIVVFVFLGRARPTIIPLVAVPVSIIGTFAVLLALGYSANTISLLAMILAIGIVVDDAIVVVENVEKVMHEEPDLSPADATRKAMKEITGPIIAITLVLLSVFVPVAFLSGSSGVLFRQFAVTISAAMVISAINALTLSPALCAVLMKPGEPVSFMKNISDGINSISRGYGSLVRRLARLAILSIALTALFMFATARLGAITPSGFMPAEDKGFIMATVTLPPGASLNRTFDVMQEGQKIFEEDEAVESAAIVAGFSLIDGGLASNGGVAFIRLTPFEERTGADMHSTAIVRRLTEKLQQIPNANFLALNPPAIPGIGTTGGFEMMVEALQGQDAGEMAAVTRSLIVNANQNEKLSAVYTTFDASSPQIRLDIDREKVYALGLTLPQVFTALQGTLGGIYVNDITLFGKNFTVWVNGAPEARDNINALYDIRVRNANGEMVRVSSFATAEIDSGPRSLVRYNNYRSVAINGSPAPGVGDGEAIAEMERIADEVLPDGFAYEWTGMALEVKSSAGQTTIVLGFAMLFAYLFLVALYESWNVPISVMLSVAGAVLAAIFGVWVVGSSLDVYVQIGIVVLIALAAKNAILIVEFALMRLGEGESIEEATVMGAQERFRPVMMTSFAFIAGLVPLVTASGPGADSMFAVGVPVFAGMIGSAVIGVILIPLLFIVFEHMRDWTRPKDQKVAKGLAEKGDAA
ncbi:hydrophobe/amphiphile efflux-1 (HAE1) family protein [Rhodovulum imhoffii]|uniref:Efflux pump membrane transporter n=1 Tax=Rhodovulum imhoffii TaxID=365340 RepID=A0A2T5BQC9_9RHOB|nr:efflux RND transporter permease subunit [Rhodovulum imhoffii]MBK5933670.1 hydrophobe/amphiphile efflux-1 family RND transporter [Rhodovulum imhoffii]PTN01350.1 hydrophobe/amphiphile efflux-1 (HAE1) family protein [Rhodovulum imhoffii]